jgi:sulfate transport system ATP-binding protein
MAIRVEHVSKRFGGFVALDDVSFEVESGELVALLGPSGGGKSTILRIIAGLEDADAGQVFLDGAVADHLDSKARRVGFVFQHYALFRHMTVAENIGFGLEVQGIPPHELTRRVDELLDLVGLVGHGERTPAQLSGGQRQRVALARALAPKPRLLLLDEPFGAVDAKVRKELRRWLRRLHDETHVTSIFVTHDQDEAFDVADRVVVVQNGRIEQVGAPRDVLDTPASEFVARFFGDVNIFDAEVQGGLAVAGPLKVQAGELPEGASVRLVIRSYDIKLWRDDRGIVTVRRLTALGDRVRVEAEIDGLGPVLAHFPRRSSLLREVEVGCRASLEVTQARAYPRPA